MLLRILAVMLLLAQQTLRAADAPPPNPAAEGLKTLLLMGIFIVGFWLFLIAPQRKRAKELAATLKNLKAGDKVVTNSGILGVVLSIKDKTLSIRSADTKLEILKSSVLEVLERGGEASESKS